MSEKPRILLVDDDQDLLHLIRMRLQANGLDVSAVGSAQKAISELGRYRPHVVITDLRMPGMDGMALFECVQERFLQLPVIILTAHGTIPDAVAAVQRGVFSYLVKPFDANVLLDKIHQALSQSSPQDEHDANEGESWRREIVSRSPSMETLLQQAKAAARTDVSVLIQSETGTGKELLAKAIHRASNRRDAAFMTLNCAAIPETLLESELFGHAAGAFTGAGKATEGLFKAADKGTVFLDEIGDMPLSAQAKLLRVLEQGEVRPVGSTETTKVDVRILSATHHDLHEKVRAGSFREDLFYRLNVITLEQPPLAARREDIPLLANHFAQHLCERHNREGGVRFAPEAMELMVSAPWPGNVRQLLNVVEQCVVLSPQDLIPRQLVERALRFKPEKLLSMNDARDRFEHDYLIRLLNLAEGNIALAARLAERNRSEFYNLLKRHDLDPAQFRKSAE